MNAPAGIACKPVSASTDRQEYDVLWDGAALPWHAATLKLTARGETATLPIGLVRHETAAVPVPDR